MKSQYYFLSTFAGGLWLSVSEELKDIFLTIHNNEVAWLAGCFMMAFLTSWLLRHVARKRGEKFLYVIAGSVSLWLIGFFFLWFGTISIHSPSYPFLLLASLWGLAEMMVASLITLQVYKYVMMSRLRILEPNGI